MKNKREEIIVFQKLVAVEKLNLTEQANAEFQKRAKEYVFYDDIPASEEEVIRRAQDADGILVNITTQITANIIKACPKLRYIGMCCSLYDENSASVDIRCAREQGITVYGVRDYGDAGVAEYVICELTALLHGFHGKRFGERPLELTGIPVGIIGMGATGQVVARALKFFGADVRYYSRSRKPEIEEKGIAYLSLEELLSKSTCICCCLNKFVTILNEAEFQTLGNHKILFNTGLTPACDLDALKKWLAHGDNYYFCDSLMALGEESLQELESVSCYGGYSGATYQAVERLTQKVLDNMDRFLGTERESL